MQIIPRINLVIYYRFFVDDATHYTHSNQYWRDYSGNSLKKLLCYTHIEVKVHLFHSFASVKSLVNKCIFNKPLTPDNGTIDMGIEIARVSIVLLKFGVVVTHMERTQRNACMAIMYSGHMVYLVPLQIDIFPYE